MSHKTMASVILSFSFGVCFFLAFANASDRNPGGSLSDDKGGMHLGFENRRAVDASKPISPDGVSMRVLWTVSGYVMGKTSIWGENEARSLLFKPLDINETGIVFEGRACGGVTFKRETVNAVEYLNKVWHITPETLGIHENELQVFKTDCDLPGFQEYIRLRDNRLIVPINGVFFFFAPAVTR
jgi:hypothetical protein